MIRCVERGRLRASWYAVMRPGRVSNLYDHDVNATGLNRFSSGGRVEESEMLSISDTTYRQVHHQPQAHLHALWLPLGCSLCSKCSTTTFKLSRLRKHQDGLAPVHVYLASASHDRCRNRQTDHNRTNDKMLFVKEMTASRKERCEGRSRKMGVNGMRVLR